MITSFINHEVTGEGTDLRPADITAADDDPAGRSRHRSAGPEYRAGADRRSRRCGGVALCRVLHGQYPQLAYSPGLCAGVQPVLRVVRRSRPDPGDDPAA